MRDLSGQSQGTQWRAGSYRFSHGFHPLRSAVPLIVGEYRPELRFQDHGYFVKPIGREDDRQFRVASLADLRPFDRQELRPDSPMGCVSREQASRVNADPSVTAWDAIEPGSGFSGAVNLRGRIECKPESVTGDRFQVEHGSKMVL